MDTKALKDKILQLAMQGKLVAQDENDELASVLLERIKEEKEQLIKDKVIKKEKSQPDIIEGDKLFNIPNGWEWCRLGNICRFINGDRGKNYPSKKDLIDVGIPFINAGHLINGEISKISMNYISEEKYESLSSGKVNNNDIIYCLRGTLGKNAVVKDMEKGAIASSLVIIRLVLNKSIDIKFLYYFMNSKYELVQRNSYDNGSAQPNLSADNVKKFVMPIPPIDEQKRIVAKLDSIFKLIDELDNNKEELSQNISDARNKVLQLAIQGKLVSQDENDEPASVLLEKIKEEKELLIKNKVIRKEKSLPDIGEDEKSFEQPNGWKWCRFGQATICRDGDRIPVSTKDRENRAKIYDYYGASGVIDKIDDYLFDKPLLLIGEDGANLISRSTPIAFIADGKYWVNNHAHVIDTLDLATLRYLEIYINAIDLKPYVTGTAQPKLNQANLNKIVISLPPLEEQKRIVAKVDAIMNYLDMLEKEMN